MSAPDDPRANERSLPEAPRGEDPDGRRGLRRRLALAALVTWCALAFAQEATVAVAGLRARSTAPASDPGAWRHGMRPVRRLARCAGLAREVLPADSRTILWTARRDFYEWRWAAYLLPDRALVLHAVDAGPGGPTHVLAVDAELPVAARLLAERGPCRVWALR